ncbi:LamG domain-containing protein [bacterium]|nr:MAG: LamG domain-containing protein [bacterium]
MQAETPLGIGLDFDGTKGGLLIPDLPVLALTDALTISTWVYLRGYVQAGPNAQILFRGDDRNGLDPYSLVVHSDGMIAFEICSASGGDGVNYRIPLKQWVHVTASFDAVLSEAKLWIDGKCVKTSEILHQPFLNLAKGSAPGLGIGNVHNDKGPHNQPLNGTVADLRLYNSVLKPTEVGYRPF